MHKVLTCLILFYLVLKVLASIEEDRTHSHFPMKLHFYPFTLIAIRIIFI